MSRSAKPGNCNGKSARRHDWPFRCEHILFAPIGPGGTNPEKKRITKCLVHVSRFQSWVFFFKNHFYDLKMIETQPNRLRKYPSGFSNLHVQLNLAYSHAFSRQNVHHTSWFFKLYIWKIFKADTFPKRRWPWLKYGITSISVVITKIRGPMIIHFF